MREPFRQAISIQSVTTEEVAASASIPDDSPWYAGHFPGHPILPGIAILALVQEAIQATCLAAGKKLTITGVSRVRFRLPASPGDPLSIRAIREERRGGWAFPFNVTVRGETLCSGVFMAHEEGAPTEQKP